MSLDRSFLSGNWDLEVGWELENRTCAVQADLVTYWTLPPLPLAARFLAEEKTALLGDAAQQ